MGLCEESSVWLKITKMTVQLYIIHAPICKVKGLYGMTGKRIQSNTLKNRYIHSLLILSTCTWLRLYKKYVYIYVTKKETTQFW